MEWKGQCSQLKLTKHSVPLFQKEFFQNWPFSWLKLQLYVFLGKLSDLQKSLFQYSQLIMFCSRQPRKRNAVVSAGRGWIHGPLRSWKSDSRGLEDPWRTPGAFKDADDTLCLQTEGESTGGIEAVWCSDTTASHRSHSFPHCQAPVFQTLDCDSCQSNSAECQLAKCHCTLLPVAAQNCAQCS